jgi:CheY-like chemotaxis protein
VADDDADLRALQVLQRDLPVLLDINMPEPNGLQVCREFAVARQYRS